MELIGNKTGQHPRRKRGCSTVKHHHYHRKAKNHQRNEAPHNGAKNQAGIVAAVNQYRGDCLLQRYYYFIKLNFYYNKAKHQKYYCQQGGIKSNAVEHAGIEAFNFVEPHFHISLVCVFLPFSVKSLTAIGIGCPSW